MNCNLIVENNYTPDSNAFLGNKFLTGNGYMGVRGTLCEYGKEFLPAINLSGIYDQVGNQWRESVNAPNGIFAYVIADGRKYTLPEAPIKSHYLRLNIEEGILYRNTVYTTDKGEISLSTEQMVSMSNPNLILQSLTVKSSYPAEITVVCGIDGDIWDINGPHLKNMEFVSNGKTLIATAVTYKAGIPINTSELSEYTFEATEKIVEGKNRLLRHICFWATQNQEYIIKRKISVTANQSNNILLDTEDYQKERKKHTSRWKEIWETSFIEIDGDNEAELALNYSIYHLNCIAPRHSKSLSIPARGLSGQVYKGAVFWDTEMFMLDYFLFNYPEIAKTLLMYRIDTLSGALEKAKSYGFKGAFYAWESQEGGFDACSDYNVVDVFTKRPMRTFFRDKQVHISAAIVFALVKYIKFTGDISILKNGGGQVIQECARFYRSLLLKHLDSDKYEIHDVIGPDEYHERINNNAYTNAMAKFVFNAAVEYQPYIEENMAEYTGLAEKIYIQEPNKDGLIEQFDGYFSLEDCRVNDVRARLLDKKEYWGGAYGVASHTQVIKQADVVAMLCMLKGKYSSDVVKANLNFYEPRTEHGSSLSACMYSLLSCYTGNPDFAYPFFIKSASADLTPGGKEWAGLIYIGGTHPASEGGAWQVAIKGFAGVEIINDEIICTPRLPQNWNMMKFKINYKKQLYKITVKKDSWTVDKI